MELRSPIVIVSAFGRGHWLAAALSREGIKTTVLDVSSKLGVWPSEDLEGPFGFFRNEKISESQMERLYSDDSFEELHNGFTLWLPEGPLECKGPLTKFKIDNSGLAPQVKEALLPSASDKLQKTVGRNVTSFDFDQSWLLHFAHQWAGTTFKPNALAATEGASLPIFSSFLVRQATRDGLEKSFAWLRSKGVEVIKPQKIVDASFGAGKTVTGLEIAGENQGLLKLEQLVWMLSSEETYFLNERLGKYLFNEGPLESEWCWVRYRVSLQACTERDALPLHTVLLDDVSSPWTHENMMVIQRTSSAEQFDVWMRMPTVQRFNKEYLTSRSKRMKDILLRRMSLAQPEVLSFPQEYYYTYAQLGAPRFPVFSAKHNSRRGRVAYGNLHLDGPEVWPHFAWTAMFAKNEISQMHIQNWWREKLLKEQKEKRKEAGQ
ncbi:hypothetical protein B9G69_013590 [Bdellovibrio sp. SKB1291214]|uniref:hypothetical protein n=1 Tax=Bdellovibrio sp. SKB1291214 TaxID=1732569 RepID=UPI000B519919|nr:hypothetical protein [Bdellovibrio sp. SKB1291214]UYL08078.1 hypothetical protein B9G69_013590 [Bdellovibrio sp. SKB1291214]